MWTLCRCYNQLFSQGCAHICISNSFAHVSYARALYTTLFE